MNDFQVFYCFRDEHHYIMWGRFYETGGGYAWVCVFYYLLFIICWNNLFDVNKILINICIYERRRLSVGPFNEYSISVQNSSSNENLTQH